jgi:hypothetical protein
MDHGGQLCWTSMAYRHVWLILDENDVPHWLIIFGSSNGSFCAVVHPLDGLRLALNFVHDWISLLVSTET